MTDLSIAVEDRSVPQQIAQDDAMSRDEPLVYQPMFCPEGQDPYTMVEWKTADAILKDHETGEVIFHQENVEAPVTWSDRAIRIVAQKYFYGKLGTDNREHSVRQIVERVVTTTRTWLVARGYFDEDNVDAFCNDLTYLLLTQRGAFNSPVWFNLGIEAREQQVSACFINSVADNMDAIAALQRHETAIFKQGSGSGVNLSTLRGSVEHLSGGGIASGPVSFMRGYDAWAGIVKSGGGTRRAAAMRILNADHPDIVDFVECKSVEESIAQLLIKAGLSADFDDPKGAYAKVHFQNANHSVRVTDDFMAKVVYALEHPDEEVLWELKAVKTGEITDRIPVLKLWKSICDACWSCGDPGLQFDTTTNKWHTCPSNGRINASNPCSEFVFLDDSACNLASLNLMKFRKPDGMMDTVALRKATEIFIIAQEALVDNASYPTEEIGRNSRRYRPLGLGYANLGAYLMSIGVPYDSDEGRQVAAEFASMITAEAYCTSARLAAHKGPFDGFDSNRAAMLNVIQQHMTAASDADLGSLGIWEQALELGQLHGYRNAQVSLLAPTGTISFLMDCDTTGIEPEASLYKVKHLVGGGTVVMENRIIDMALEKLTYNKQARGSIMQYLGTHKHLDGCPHILDEHLPVFDCAIPSAGTRCLSADAHLKMTGAVQPFLSGAISKTINLPNHATPKMIGQALIRAWKNGLKAVAVYRDGCKQSQPLITAVTQKVHEEEVKPRAVRRKLANHQMNMHRMRFRFGEVKGYILATPYEDTGMPGEIFVKLSKEGSTISGLVDGWAQSISYNLQYGVPLEDLIRKFSHTKFEPSGYSSDPDIKFAHSIYDAIMRKLAAVFLDPVSNGVHADIEEAVKAAVDPPSTGNGARLDTGIDNPPCMLCGALMTRNGTCYNCPVCGGTSGCG